MDINYTTTRAQRMRFADLKCGDLFAHAFLSEETGKFEAFSGWRICVKISKPDELDEFVALGNGQKCNLVLPSQPVLKFTLITLE